MLDVFIEQVKKITAQDDRYSPEAYGFLMEALTYTQRKYERQKHVSGEELLMGFKEYAIRTFGPFALQIMERWGISSTNDVGHIVFNLVDQGVLAKREEDTFLSFRNIFDFEKVLRSEYLQQLEGQARNLK